jgi:hypothetical protein
MRTLCQHIFDLAQNSINANAENIHIIVDEDIAKNIVKIVVEDDGVGIKPEALERVKNTFFTTRSRKKRGVGLGLALMDATCQRCGGKLTIESRYRYGTTITAIMKYDNIDRPPLGDLADLYTSLLLLSSEKKVIWTLEHNINKKGYELKNKTVREKLKIISFSYKGIRKDIYKYILDKEKEIAKNS